MSVLDAPTKPHTLQQDPIRPGFRGVRVTALQKMLRAKGFKEVGKAGVYDDELRGALNKACRLAKHGFVGVVTLGHWNAIAGLQADAGKPFPMPVKPHTLDEVPVRRGNRGVRVVAIQELLEAKGYDEVGKPGVYDDELYAALKNASKKAGVGFVGAVWGNHWKAIAALNKRVVFHDPNVGGVTWLEKHPGPKEQWDKNDGPWLRAQYNDGGDHDDWFADAEAPYCARIGVFEAYQEVGLDLDEMFPGVNWNFCPSIEACIRAGRKSVDGKWKWIEVNKKAAKRGDVMLHGGSLSTHVSRASEDADADSCVTTGANTPKGLDGDQSGLGSGDGIWTKDYPLSTFRCVGRLVPA